MVWTVVALILMVLMGGIIAYFGDLIGRRFGKKRVTLFGLRPRYTAILITSVTGILIAGSSAAVLFGIVPSIRNAILKGEVLYAENKELAADIELGRKAKLATDLELKNQHLQVTNLTAKIDPLEKDVAAKRAELASAAAQVTATEARLSAQKAEYARLSASSGKLKAKNLKLAEANTTLAENNVALAKRNLELDRENKEFVARNATLIHYNDDLAKEIDDRSKQNVELVRSNTSLVKLKGELEKARDTLLRDAETHRTALNDLHDEREKLKAENDRLNSENTQFQQILKTLGPGYQSVRDAYFAARNRRVAIHKDEDLARIIIPAETDPTSVRSLVNVLLGQSSATARLRGAGSRDNVRAVQVIDRQLFGQLPSGQIGSVDVTGEQLVDAVVRALSWQDTPSVLVAVAVTNSVEEEPAAIDLRSFANHLVYQKGQLIATRTFNPRLPTTEIFGEVVTFLKELGRGAVERGVIPRLDPLSGEPEVGAMSGNEVISLVERIREVGGRARLRAVAEIDIRSADPLKVRFDVTP